MYNYVDKDNKKSKLPMIVKIQTSQLPPPVSSSPKKGDRSYTPSLEAHSFNIGWWYTTHNKVINLSINQHLYTLNYSVKY